MKMHVGGSIRTTLILFSILISGGNLVGITLGEAIDLNSLEWIAETGPLDSPIPIEVKPENLWHPVTDDSFDGVDSLTVIPPDSMSAFATLKTTVNGPARVRFASKSPLELGANQLHFEQRDLEGKVLQQKTLTQSDDWTESEEILLREGPHILAWTFYVFSDSKAQVWLDQIEIHNMLPSDLLDGSVPTVAPLEKALKLEVTFEGLKDLRFQWYKDNVLIENESTPRLFIDPPYSPTSANYRVSVSDDRFTFNSEPVLVEHFDLGQILGLDELEYWVPDQPDFDYNGLIIREEAAFHGEPALFLKMEFEEKPPIITTPTLLSTEIQGPVLLSYYNTGPLKVEVNGKFPEGTFHAPSDLEGWSYSYIPIPEPGTNLVTWSNNWAIATGSGLFYTNDSHRFPV